MIQIDGEVRRPIGLNFVKKKTVTMEGRKGGALVQPPNGTGFVRAFRPSSHAASAPKAAKIGPSTRRDWSPALPRDITPNYVTKDWASAQPYLRTDLGVHPVIKLITMSF